MRNFVVCTAILFGMSAASDAGARELTFEDRLTAQKSIEQIYWNHRTWPAENPGPKPPLSAVMSDDAIRAKVEDYLEKSNALEKWWQRPIGAEDLQRELERMTRDTRSPRMLRELFAALGNDPLVIADTLARQTLADRLVRHWYATDTRFHGELQGKAEAALAACANLDCMSSMGGEYTETTWRLREDDAVGTVDAVPDLDAEEWATLLDRLAAKIGGSPQSLSTGRSSRLEETSDAFVLSAVVAQGETEIETATVVWRKRSFEAWWAAERRTLGSTVANLSGEFVLPSAAALDSACTNDTWTLSLPGLPAARYGHTAVWTGSEMIVWGGSDGSAIMSTGGRYVPSTDSWTFTSMGANLPERRYDHTAVWTGTEMIVWGGRGEQALNLDSGGRYAPSTNTWSAISKTDAPPARHVHTAVWTGTEMIVWGGLWGGPGLTTNTGGRYRPSTDTWTPTSTATNVPTKRYRHTAVWTSSRMIVWGGYDGTYANTGAVYNPSTNDWTATSTGANVPSGRYYHTAVWTGSRLVVWGGSYFDGTSYQSLNTGGQYNLATDSWTATATSAGVPGARLGHSAVWTGTEMIVWGGGPNIGSGGRYNPSSNGWIATSTGANAPGGRTSHTAVWTGTEMIVWGGSNSSTQLNTGARFKPSTNSWVATSTQTTFPDEREDHTRVWTGAEMIVWGGATDVSTWTNSGGRYDPSTGNWTPTSTGANVPSARRNHTAVWTGTEMIVWGGGAQVNTGGRYNPATNGWTPTSTASDVPLGRYDHTAVWTGTRMIVWGGYGDGAQTNTGGLYDPAANAWTATSIGDNVPAGRSWHAAVWTGTELIVWGGYPRTNTGGRYNPTTDSWLPTSFGTGVPAPRYNHTGVWTGTELIVWGGTGVGPPLNDGGRYTPTTDAWESTSMGANTPSVRTRHSAVWTGAEMIVWGGYSADGQLKTGGRYDPIVDGWMATSTGANVPHERYGDVAVWSGHEMLIFGGFPYTSDLGLYCGCPSVSWVYRDADADGFGDLGQPIMRCDGTVPPGYVVNTEDCDDGHAAAHPGATETCDGLDNDCNTLVDDGIAAPVGQVDILEEKQGDAALLSWAAIDGATGYDVVWGSLSVLLSSSGDFTEGVGGCVADQVTETVVADKAMPESGDGFWYLVRPVNCGGDGTYDSGQPGQVESRDAEIAASALSCP